MNDEDPFGDEARDKLIAENKRLRELICEATEYIDEYGWHFISEESQKEIDQIHIESCPEKDCYARPKKNL